MASACRKVTGSSEFGYLFRHPVGPGYNAVGLEHCGAVGDGVAEGLVKLSNHLLCCFHGPHDNRNRRSLNRL